MKLPLWIIAASLFFITIFQGAMYSLEKTYLSSPPIECGGVQEEKFI